MIDFNEYTDELRAAAQHLEDAVEILTRIDAFSSIDSLQRWRNSVQAKIDRRNEDPRATEEDKPEPVPATEKCSAQYMLFDCYRLQGHTGMHDGMLGAWK